MGFNLVFKGLGNHGGHSICHGNYPFGHKCGNVGSGIHKFESPWPMLINVTIRWGIHRGATGRGQVYHMSLESLF